MNILKRIKYYKYYKSIISENKDTLLKKYNIYVDDLYRLYTIVSITETEYNSFGIRHEQQFNLSSSEATKLLNEALNEMTINKGKIVSGDDFLISKTDSHIKLLDQYLINIGIAELYGMSEKSRIDKYNMKYVVEYKHLNMRFIANLIVLGIFGFIGGVVSLIIFLIINYFIV